MPTLRDIRLPDAFKYATNQAFRAIKSTDNLTLQGFQHIIAQALGARSLEAFLAPPKTDRTLPAAAAPVAEDWVVLLITSKKDGQQQAWHCNELIAEGWQQAEPDHLLFALPHLMAFSHINTVSNSKGFQGDSEMEMVALSKWRPTLFVLLQCDAEGVREALAESDDYQRELDTFGFSQSDWQEEVDAGNVVSGYTAWVVSQLEQWRDDCLMRR